MNIHQTVKLTITVPKVMRDSLRYIAALKNLEDQDFVITANELAVVAIYEYVNEAMDSMEEEICN